MSVKIYTCPYCNAPNQVEKKDFLHTLKDNAAVTFEKTAVVKAAEAITARWGGIGAVVVGTLFTIQGVRDYFSLECGTCHERFLIKRWED